MNRWRWEYLLGACFMMAAETLGHTCHAQSQVSPPPANVGVLDAGEDVHAAGEKTLEPRDSQDIVVDDPNGLGRPFLNNLWSDQKAIWSSPIHLHSADASWLFPMAAVTGGFFATDRSVAKTLSKDPNRLNRFRTESDIGLAALVGAGGGLYLWNKFSPDDHRSETGVLAGEAAIDSLVVNSAFQFSFGRERPYQDQGRGAFFQGGTSFPSNHAAMAWSIASVLAHEYHGPLTQLLVYGLATGVSASRVMGKEHFPSDVFVGSAIGWLVGRQVYRSHHDPGLGGIAAASLAGDNEGEDSRDRQHMGSSFVPLDSWVYQAFERLAGLRYVDTAIMGLKPWTRLECARLVTEAGDALQERDAPNSGAEQLNSRLQLEFAYELNLLDGGRNFTANLESVYARSLSISGPPLTDSFHFGQTVAYDFGRPFERGTNGQIGGSFFAAAGPLAVYVRAEFQHAPSAPGLSPPVVNLISQADGGVAVGGKPVPVSEISAGPLETVNRPRLLDTYATVNLSNWQLVIGRQSLDWSPGPGDSMIWNNNVEPVDMVRLVNPEPFELPGFLRHLGPVRVDQFFGRLEGHPYVPRPFVYAQKFNIKPFPFLELGFARRTVIGGTGGDPLTAHNLLGSYIGRTDPKTGSVPGDNESEMDWTFYVPKARNYIVLFGDAYAEDDGLPIQNPARNPWHPGIYITHFPKIPKLDFHMEGVSTEQKGIIHGGGNHGVYNYWNETYFDGNTVNGNLLGNTVGRDGRALQSWFTYWISPTNTLQFTYRRNTVSSDFVPGGGAWQDYAVRSNTFLKIGFYVKTELQCENISRFPLLFNGPKRNFTALVEVGFIPKGKK
jgi:membrane-associated phospholipid phosphatase